MNEHEQKLTLSVDIYYPDHEPRTESALFARTKHHLVKVLDTPCWICGSKDQREVHHFHAEWADADGIDWDRMRKLHPNFPWSTFTKAEDFIDSEYNMMVLCLTPETRVLMADGSEKCIETLRIGDKVIGHDGKPHRITDHFATQSDGRVFEINGVKASANHPFLTPKGWVKAGDLKPGMAVFSLGMAFPQMLRLRSIKDKVFERVIRPVLVPMMYYLGFFEAAAKMAFHDVSMLHDATLAPRFITHRDANVALRRDLPISDFPHWSRQTIQAIETAGIGAKPLGSAPSLERKHSHRRSAARAWLRNFLFADGLAPSARAGHRAGGIAVIDAGSDQKGLLANAARLLNPRAHLGAGWRPVKHVEVLPYEGKLYDITVEGCKSFIANGVVVHNCKKHHTGKDHGIHMLPYPIWIMQRNARADFQFSPDEPASTALPTTQGEPA